MALEQGNTVWLIDGVTHVVLPGTAWGHSVREKLTATGHSVQVTDCDPNTLFRGDDELARRDVLLDSTGL